MHPAYSVIFFTTASGAGYGLLFWTAAATVFGLASDRWASLTSLTIALVMITAGLLSSTAHLGRPERAINAFSQWRSSWLSREGVAAVATYGPAGLLWLLLLFGVDNGLTKLLALLAAIGAVATVYCTGMIYASLRTIRHWHHHLVLPFYLAASAATGFVLLTLVFALFGAADGVTAFLAAVTLAAAAVVKFLYWREIDTDPGRYTAEMATGLGHLGKVRPLDPPHTMPNFVMREMGYRVGRKHVEKLRKLVYLCLFALPVVLLLLAIVTGWFLFFSLLASISAGAGVVAERWLFFAEAEHVSMLYYGADRA